jgi:phage FluMu protein Com
MMCARDYLQLNKPASERVFSRKCLMCPTTVNPMVLRGADRCYAKDFMLMSIDPRTDYACFHSEKGCGFTGSQNDLDRHMQNECPYRMTSCLCGRMYRANEKQQHFASCSHYSSCRVCGEYIAFNVLHEHLEKKHAKVLCRHIGCNKLLALDALEAHMKERCPHRSMACPRCSAMSTAFEYPNHVMGHVQDDKKHIDRLMSQVTMTMKHMTVSIATLNSLVTGETQAAMDTYAP